ncbi:hypothetical protein ACGK9U_02665 [Mariniflexile sp. HNIBRBA6329]|uniref:hypothetical protein n=1 Tax=Mariniflexile sp. HNIBRBA6329 TaxID=3373088 RepID=UPI00374618C9
MLKFNGLILTLALSLFTLFVSESKGDLATKKITHTHDLKIDHSYNTLAISTNNSFLELAGFEKEKEQTFDNNFFAKKPISEKVLESDFQYLKVCDFLDLNLTTRSIIYPFHSFL